MDLTPDGPLGERDKDMNTLPAENVSTTHQPPHETDGCCHPFSRVGINVIHEKKVDLGVLRDAECNWLGEVKPISTV